MSYPTICDLGYRKFNVSITCVQGGRIVVTAEKRLLADIKAHLLLLYAIYQWKKCFLAFKLFKKRERKRAEIDKKPDCSLDRLSVLAYLPQKSIIRNSS